MTLTTVESEFVAPGVTRADYHLVTSAGPLAVTLVSIDVREPTVRLGIVLAADRLISNAETVSAMAARTGAVAGINGDYFDINGTNQPLGIVVRDGALVRTPSRRAAMTVTTTRTIHFGAYAFAGTVTDGALQVPLTGVDIWPPQGGSSLMEPVYGPLAPAAGVSLATLAPLDGGASSPFGGRYRVTASVAATGAVLSSPALAYGPAALRTAPLPRPGDELEIRGDTDPALAGVASAIGGGPLLVRDGQPFADPDAPAAEESSVRYPVAGAALLGDGTLVLMAVDGRLPDRSIGLTRPEFGALMRGIGASDGMAFDSGGSATLVARVLGDARATVRNTPSDGVERPVADGLFVYSDAPAGPPSRLVVRPERIRALRGTAIPLQARVTDAAGHPLGAASGPWGAAIAPPQLAHLSADGVLHAGAASGSGTATIARSQLRAQITVDVLDRVARLAIAPARPAVAPEAPLALQTRGFDAAGRPVIVGSAVTWTTTSGTIGNDGVLHAARADARVTARVGATQTTTLVRVGSHLEPLAAFAAPERWTFATVPAHGPGSAGGEAGCGCLALSYDFRGVERAAFARLPIRLADGTQRIIIDVDGDAGGTGLRVQIVDGDATRHAITLARRIDWTGTRTLAAVIPGDAPPPLTLESVYAVATLGGGTVHANGTLRLRNARAVVAGSSAR